MGGKFNIFRSSAGSGKTYELSKSYVKIILATPSNGGESNSDYFKSILALTFTKAAAEEMKNRILSFLSKLGKLRNTDEKSLDPDAKELLESIRFDLKRDYPELSISAQEIGNRAHFCWRKILHDYSEFSVQTIDSFVNSLTRSFYRDLGLTLNMNLSFDQGVIIEEAVDSFLNDLGPDNQWTDWIKKYFSYQRKKDQSWRLRELIQKFASSFLTNWEKGNAAEIQNFSMKEFVNFREQLSKTVNSLESNLRKKGEEGVSLLKRLGLEVDDFHSKRNGAGAYFGKIASKGFDQSVFKNLEKIQSGDQILEHKDGNAATITSIQNNSADILDRISAINEFIEQNQSRFYLSQNALQLLQRIGMISEIINKLNELKVEKDVIFLDDLQELIKKNVIEEPVPFVFERVGVKFKHILIDEFQDTSGTQWLNILPLVSNGLGLGMESLVVGDAKQSVYSWRGGDPELLVSLPDLEEKFPFDNIKDHLVPLKANKNETVMENNFRSAPEVVEFNNLFFNATIDGAKEKFPRVAEYYKDHNQRAVKEFPGKVDLYQFSASEDRKFEELGLEVIPELINKALEEGFELEDIAILVRKNKQSRAILEMLLEEGIPAIAGETLLLSKNSGVRSFLSFINYLLVPDDQYYRWELIKYLSEAKSMSPFGVKETRDLFYLDSPEFWQKVSKQFGKGLKLSELRHESVYTMLERYIRCFGLDQIPAHRPYIFSFLDMVFHFSKKGRSGIRDFIEYWEDKKENAGINAGDQAKGLRILSIHKSKGLEFPVVICPFLNWSMSERPSFLFTDKIEELQDEFPFGIFSVTSSLENTSLDAEFGVITENTFIESLNILYVAFTRARERLIGIAPAPPKTKGSLSNIGNLIDHFFLQFESDQKGETLAGRDLVNLSFGNELKRNSEVLPVTERTEIQNREQIGPKPWINIKIEERWEEASENERRPRDYGILVHGLMEEVFKKSSLKKLKDQISINPSLNEEEKVRLNDSISRILKDEKLDPYFSEDANVYNEQGISSGEEIKRPDRVVFENGNWRVLDYKTGKKETEHRLQLEEYASLLKTSLGLESEPEKCLLYFKDDGGIETDIFN